MDDAQLVYFDIETYKNYLLIRFKGADFDKRFEFRKGVIDESSKSQLRTILSLSLKKKICLVGFNSTMFDLPLLTVILHKNISVFDVWLYAQKLINDKSASRSFYSALYVCGLSKECLDLTQLLHIDIHRNADVKFTSLKVYATRLGVKELESLPYKYDTVLGQSQMDKVRDYCDKDIEATRTLFEHIKEKYPVRFIFAKMYSDYTLLSKTDAQIAEFIFRHKYNLDYKQIISRNERSKQTSFSYIPPKNIMGMTPSLSTLIRQISSAVFTLDTDLSLDTSDFKSKIPNGVKIGVSVYTIGVGGLHSTSKSLNYSSKEDEDIRIIDVDVVSYYPSIILSQGLKPVSLGDSFLFDYRSFFEDRVKAKREGDKSKAEVYKIILNGSYGKFNDKYSCLYSPRSLLQVTLSGQLYLLMLIEQLEMAGIKVISANTDGVTFVYNAKTTSENVYKGVLERWQSMTGFVLEEVEYTSYYHKDVSNYFASKNDNTVKCKGDFFIGVRADKACTARICYEAVIKHCLDGKPLIDTIKECEDMSKFMIMGYSKDSVFVNREDYGKVVRFYWANSEKDLVYTGKGTKIPMSDNCKVLMSLPEGDCLNKHLKNIDYTRYLNYCEGILKSVNYSPFDSILKINTVWV